jgi:hypothetical protein
MSGAGQAFGFHMGMKPYRAGPGAPPTGGEKRLAAKAAPTPLASGAPPRPTTAPAEREPLRLPEAGAPAARCGT